MIRLCIACRYFSMDDGWPHYSTYTPGQPPSIDCAKGVFLSFDTGSLFTKAETCPHFEVSELAKSKGWPEE